MQISYMTIVGIFLALLSFTNQMSSTKSKVPHSAQNSATVNCTSCRPPEVIRVKSTNKDTFEKNIWDFITPISFKANLSSDVKTVNITFKNNSYINFAINWPVVDINMTVRLPWVDIVEQAELPETQTTELPETQTTELPKTQTQKLLYRQPRTDKIPIRKVSDYNITGPIESLSEIPGYDENQLLNEKRE